MTVAEIIQIVDLGGTLSFAVIVWMEIRGMRKESFALMQEIRGYIQATKKS
jgi:hypothetical protein